MSEAAVVRRLKTVDQLRHLCLSLMKAKKESDERAGKANLTMPKDDFGGAKNKEKQTAREK